MDDFQINFTDSVPPHRCALKAEHKAEHKAEAEEGGLPFAGELPPKGSVCIVRVPRHIPKPARLHPDQQVNYAGESGPCQLCGEPGRFHMHDWGMNKLRGEYLCQACGGEPNIYRKLGFSDILALLRDHLRCRTWQFNNEKELQVQVESYLSGLGILYLREYRLTEQDRPDFWIINENIAVEVKTIGSQNKHLRQLKRYADHPDTTGTILIAPHSYGLPHTLSGKPCAVLSLWKNMLG